MKVIKQNLPKIINTLIAIFFICTLLYGCYEANFNKNPRTLNDKIKVNFEGDNKIVLKNSHNRNLNISKEFYVTNDSAGDLYGRIRLKDIKISKEMATDNFKLFIYANGRLLTTTSFLGICNSNNTINDICKIDEINLTEYQTLISKQTIKYTIYFQFTSFDDNYGLSENNFSTTIEFLKEEDLGKDLLIDKILAENKIIKTNKLDNINKKGLYEVTNKKSNYYLYRGNVTNNYVEFAGQTWRIMRINNDGTFRIIKENPIKKAKYSIEEYPIYDISDLKYTIYSWYQTSIERNTQLDNKIINKDFCIDNYEENNITFECKNKMISKVETLSYKDYVYAGGNDSYLSNEYDYLTMTLNSNMVYTNNGLVKLDNKYYVRPVTNLISNITVSKGDGTKNNPYVIN